MQRIRFFLKLIIDYGFLFFLLLLTVSFSWANWNFNPVWDLLFARVQGFLFYLNHPLSVLPFCLIAWFGLYKTKFKEIPKTVSVYLSTPAMGEIIYNILFVKPTPNIEYLIPFWILMFVGVVQFTRKQIIVFYIQEMFFLFWFIFWFTVIGVHSTLMQNHLPPELNQYGYNLYSNIAESLGWVIASSFWLILLIKKQL